MTHRLRSRTAGDSIQDLVQQAPDLVVKPPQIAGVIQNKIGFQPFLIDIDLRRFPSSQLRFIPSTGSCDPGKTFASRDFNEDQMVTPGIKTGFQDQGRIDDQGSHIIGRGGEGVLPGLVDERVHQSLQPGPFAVVEKDDRTDRRPIRQARLVDDITTPVVAQFRDDCRVVERLMRKLIRIGDQASERTKQVGNRTLA